jgi:hypothetical protein
MAAAILALIKVFPQAVKLLNQVIDLYLNAQDAADQNAYDKKKVTRDALLSKMKTPGLTDNELKDIRRALYELNH